MLSVEHHSSHDCKAAGRVFYCETITYRKIMADSDRVVFPDEVADAKAKAAEEQGSSGAGDTNSVEEPPVEPADETPNPNVAMRNLIQAPYNCPEGYTMGADGVCRQVF